MNNNINDKVANLIDFFHSLPDETTREFENKVVKYATTHSTLEDEAILNQLINQNDERLAYTAFYCLNAMLRRKKDFYKMQINFDKYSHFSKHITYNHLWLMYQIEADLFYDYDEILSMAYELTQKLPNHVGIIHLLPATYVSIMENCDEESKKSLREKWYDKVLKASNQAILQEADYAKFYCTKARVLATNHEYLETSLLIRKAISLEDSNRQDYALRVSGYQYTDLLIKLQEQQYNIQLQLDSFNKPVPVKITNRPSSTESDLPFIFISYAHLNSDKVYPLIDKIKDLGYRIWYDEGISFGTEYNEVIAEKIVKASQVILFMSNAAVKSNYVRKELNFCLANDKEPLIIYLEETYLTAGMKMQLENNQALFYYNVDQSSFFNKLKETLIDDTNINNSKIKLYLDDYVSHKGGSKANEDYYYVDDYTAFVLDGSTNLIKTDIDANWYVENFTKEFIKQDTCQPLSQILKKAINNMRQKVIDVIDDYDFSTNTICASFGGIHLYQNKLEVLCLSDCSIIIYFKNGKVVNHTINGGLRLLDQAIIDEVTRLHQEYHIDVIDLMHSAEIRNKLIQNRLKMNKSDDYYTLAFDMFAIDYALIQTYEINEIDSIIIHSDGFDLIEDQIINKGENKLIELYQNLRKLENKDDKCNNYPRFKISDDATMISIKFTKTK